MRVVAALLATLLLVACEGVEVKKGETARNRQGLMPGPGLLSGKDGKFVIYRLEDKAEKEEPAEEKEQHKNDHATEKISD